MALSHKHQQVSESEHLAQFRRVAPRSRESFRLSLRERLLAGEYVHGDVVVRTPTTFTRYLLTYILSMKAIQRFAIGAPVAVLGLALVFAVTVPRAEIAQAEEIVRQHPQVQQLLAEGASVAYTEITNGSAEVTISPAYFLTAEFSEDGETATIRMVDFASTSEEHGAQWVADNGSTLTAYFEGADFKTLQPTDFVRVAVDLEREEVTNIYALPTSGVASGIELISETDTERTYQLPNGKTITVYMFIPSLQE